MAKQRCDVLISGGAVITMDEHRRIFADGAVAVDGETIVAVGTRSQIERSWQPNSRIEANDGIIHPGYIDGHYHAGLHLSRGSITDNPHPPASEGGGGPGVFTRWINALTEEDEQASALMAACELARNGFTGFVEAATAFWPDLVAGAATAIGIRCSVSDCMLWDMVGGEPMAADIPRAPCDAERARRELGRQLWRNAENGLVRGHVGIYGMGSATEELMREAKMLADREGAVCHQHQNLMADDAGFEKRRYGKPALVHMAEAGLIGPSSVFTHMNMLEPAEIDAVAESGMALVWHPGNFMYYGISQTGRSAFPQLHRRGTSIGFGTDIAKSWVFGDLGFIAYLVSREWGQYLTSEAVLEMFTLGGARALGMAGRTGSLAPGMKADVVIRKTDFPDAQPNVDVVRQLALISRTKGVDTVMCNGVVIVRNGALVGVDEAEIRAKARRSADNMAARAGTRPTGLWPIVA